MGEQLVGQRFALGAKLGRAASIGISASKPLCYWFKGGMSLTEATRQIRLGTLKRSTATSKRGIMPESLEYDLEQIL